MPCPTTVVAVAAALPLATTVVAVVASLPLATLLIGTTVSTTPVATGREGVPLVEIAPVPFSYRPAGDFSRAGKPVVAPRRRLRLPHALRIMARQVTAAEYADCVAAGGCPRLSRGAAAGDRPMVGVSWRDATAYAAWITRRTGVVHRLPSDQEWVFAAGAKAADEVLPPVDPANPARAWLARYEIEAARDRPAADPQPVGTFGRNEHGLSDLAGNVWEWTDTCFVRGDLDKGGPAPGGADCGVRVVQGAHRTAMTDFVRDPRAGGCAVGVPPANLGFRLVVERPSLLRRLLRRARF